MSAFWMFARRLLRYRLLMAGTLVMVFLAAGSLGVGILGAAPVLGQLLDPKGKTLADYAVDHNDRIKHFLPRWEPLVRPFEIPGRWIDAIPTDRYTGLVWTMSALAVLAVFGS